MPAGRPTALTHETRRTLLECLRAGSYVSTACQIAGISEDTFYEWRERARAGGPANQQYVEFMEAAGKVVAESEEAMIKQLRRLGEGDWRALAWFLSRRFRNRWGREADTARANVSAPIKPVVVKTTRRSED